MSKSISSRTMQAIRSLLLITLLPVAAAKTHAQQFTQPVLVPTGSRPSSIVASTLSAGGPPALCYTDAVVSGNSYTSLHCRPDQTGSFPSSSEPLPLPSAAPIFSMADIDGDNRTDFLFFEFVGASESELGNAHGNGNGGTMGLLPVSELEHGATNPGWTLVGSARFTSSGHLDAYAVDSANHALVVALGDGVRYFTQSAILPLPDNATGILTADINGNGKTGILALGATQPRISTFIGNGDGTFVSGPSYSLPGGIFSMLLADLDGDSRPDLVVEGPNGALSYFPALATGGFASSAIAISGAQNAATGNGGHLIAIADRNGDGFPDIVTATPLGISVLLGRAVSTGIPRVVSAQLLGVYDPGQGSPTAGRTSFAPADFNGDTYADLAVDNPQGILILYGKADGSFAAPLLLSGTLSAIREPSAYGSDFTLTATFTPPANGMGPTGTVTFAIDGATVGTAPLLSNAATYTVTAPTYVRGTHTLTATYSGDANYSASTLTGSHAIAGLRSQTTIDVTTPTIFYGQVADGQGSVAAIDTASNATINGGTITFYDNATIICVLPINGMAGLCPANAGANFPAGLHALTAMYSGNDFYAPSTSDPGNVQVLADNTTGTLASSPNPATVGQPVTLTATFTAPYATPAGTVTFMEGASVLGTATLNAAGMAAVTTTTLPLGTHNITASLAASLNFNASVTATLQQVITAPALQATTTTLTSGTNPSFVTQAVTFTAAVASGAAIVPVGTVIFLADNVLLGTVPLSASGIASFTTSTLSQGTHNITAAYAAAATYAPSVSASLLQQVNAQGAGGFQLTINPSTLPVPIGSSVSVLVTVTPLNGFAQPVVLSCAGVPAEATCNFANTTNPAGGGSTRLTVSAAAPHNCNSNVPYFTASGPTALLDALATLALTALFRRRSRLLPGLVLTLLLALLPALSGCSGNCTDLGVRPGTYSFTVTGTSGGSPAVVVNQTVNFTAHL